MKPFGNNNNNFKTMFDSEGNMHMISGEGDIKYDSFTGRFFNDTGPGGLKQDPVTGDMWFDNRNFMDVVFQFEEKTNAAKSTYLTWFFF